MARFVHEALGTGACLLGIAPEAGELLKPDIGKDQDRRVGMRRRRP